MLIIQIGKSLAAQASTSNIGPALANQVSSNLLGIQTVRGYHKNIVEHYEDPRNVGSLDKKASNVGTGLVGAPACGDVMKLQIEVDDKDRITDAKFKTFGCGSAIASSSVATEWVKGKHLDEALSIKNSDIASHLKLPPVKLHCSMLAEDAIKAAVKDYKTKQNSDQAEKSTKEANKGSLEQ